MFRGEFDVIKELMEKIPATVEGRESRINPRIWFFSIF
jgi:hypothetical protein